MCILVHADIEDCIAWHFNKNGQFTVRSAYKVFMADKKLCMEKRGKGSGSGTSTRIDDPFWRRIWNLNCPRKLIHFMWRLGHNTLALRVNLKRRGMKIDTKCVMCERLDEDGAHLFFKCTVKHIWNILQLDAVREDLAQCLTAREAVEKILKLSPEIQRQVITLLYLWWSEQCGVREGERPRDSYRMAQLIGSYAMEWSPLKKTEEGGNRSNTKKVWRPPPVDSIKINCDGSFSENTRSGRWGFLMRTWDGGVISSGYGLIEHVSEALHSEIVGMPSSRAQSC